MSCAEEQDKDKNERLKTETDPTNRREFTRDIISLVVSEREGPSNEAGPTWHRSKGLTKKLEQQAAPTDGGDCRLIYRLEDRSSAVTTSS